MLIFYIIVGCLVIAIGSLILQFNRLALYRRRIIAHLSEPNQPYKLTEQQERLIKHCFSNGDSLQLCIKRIKQG